MTKPRNDHLPRCRDRARAGTLPLALLAATLLWTWPSRLVACPFCTAVSQTFAEELASMEVAVLARLIEAAPLPEEDPSLEMRLSRFQVDRVLKGEAWVQPEQVLKVHYFGKPDAAESFLILGTDTPDLIWASPLPLSARAVDYILQVLQLPAGPERLKFFQQYLQDPDEMLARDAYDEFAKSPYTAVMALKEDMDREQLVAWIKDTTNVSASRRRLYLTMLGVCGLPEDAGLLEQFMRSENRDDKQGLDALVACYLTLRGPDGMPVVEELFLNNADADYADTYAAIMALRFHGTESDRVSLERVLQGLRCLLARPDMADLVIPDLARWEDWSVLPQLIDLYRDADEQSNWIRVPIINYVRACPLPEAGDAMRLLEEIDPAAVKRASTFFPFAAMASPAAVQAAEAQAAPQDQPLEQPSPPPEPAAVPEADANTNGAAAADARVAANASLPSEAPPASADLPQLPQPDHATREGSPAESRASLPAETPGVAPPAAPRPTAVASNSYWPLTAVVGVVMVLLGLLWVVQPHRSAV